MLEPTPIPACAMPSTLAVRVPKSDAKYGGEFEDAVTIEHVRFDQEVPERKTGYQLSDGSKGVVFVDRITSTGAFAVPVDSLVSVDGGDDMAVVACRPRIGFAEVHPWELEVA